MSKFVTATAYLTIKADRDWRGQRIDGARILKVTQGKPGALDKDSTLVKVRITVPEESFEQVPVVDIVMPLEDLTQVTGVVEPA